MFRTFLKETCAPALLTLAIAVPAMADRPVAETVDADRNGIVEISNVSGSIIVRGWDRDEVSVEGIVGDDVEAVRVERRGARTVIEVKLPEERARRHRELSADLEIRVPVASRVEASTVSASQSISEVEGAMDLDTVSGSLDLVGRPESIQVSSVSGGVEVDAETDSLVVSTVSGALDLRGFARDVKVSAVSGQIDLGTRGSERVDVESVSTSITLDLELGASPSVSASSHSGSITLRLDRNASAEIRASSLSGRISNELGPQAETHGYGPGSSLSFTLGRGDGRVDLETFSGRVDIEER